MSLRNFLRSPLSICVAFGTLAAARFNKSRAAARAARSASTVEPAAETSARAEELARLSRRLLVAGEAEKARLARELHDGMGSTLTAVNLDLYWVRQRLADQPALASRLGRAIEVLASTVEVKRRIIHTLRPAALDNLGLPLAIESNVAEFERQSPLRVSLDLPADLPALSEHCSIALYRIYQEALACAASHSGVTTIEVAVRAEHGGVAVEISDDGVCACDEHATMTALGMRERAAAFGGTFSIAHGAGGRGTRVKVCLPHPFRAGASAPVVTRSGEPMDNVDKEAKL